ncbi:MAG: flagellar biosynthetic protein FliR [Candidatus Gastranaerophilales bacterium]|nr:flagellar biosynthetic protein FliR [Candidatus Gastranaerophilales bacterium]
MIAQDVVIQLGKMFPLFAVYLTTGFIVFARIMGFVRLAPILNRKEIPSLVKLSLALLLTIILVSAKQPATPPADNCFVLSLLLNYAAGAMLGYMAQLILLAIDAGADMINMQMGLSSAMVLDPTTSSQTSILAKLISLLGIVIFMEIGGCYWLMNAFVRSFEIFPLYATSIPLDKIVNMDYLIKMTSNVLYMGLQVASPVLLATLGQDIILGVISKTAPQVNVFQLSFLFKPVFGAAIMVWILPMLINIITDYYQSFANII